MVDIDPFSYCLMLFTFHLLSLYQNSRIGEQESETLERVSCRAWDSGPDIRFLFHPIRIRNFFQRFRICPFFERIRLLYTIDSDPSKFKKRIIELRA